MHACRRKTAEWRGHVFACFHIYLSSLLVVNRRHTHAGASDAILELLVDLKCGDTYLWTLSGPVDDTKICIAYKRLFASKGCL